MSGPTRQGVENANARRAIADHRAAEYHEAERMTAGALGPGFRPWMKLVLIDSDYCRPGRC